MRQVGKSRWDRFSRDQADLQLLISLPFVLHVKLFWFNSDLLSVRCKTFLFHHLVWPHCFEHCPDWRLGLVGLLGLLEGASANDERQARGSGIFPGLLSSNQFSTIFIGRGYIRSLRARARRFMAVTLMHDRKNAVCALFLMPIEQEPLFHVDLACRVETKLLWILIEKSAFQLMRSVFRLIFGSSICFANALAKTWFVIDMGY